jgi:hypothetical protein
LGTQVTQQVTQGGNGEQVNEPQAVNVHGASAGSNQSSLSQSRGRNKARVNEQRDRVVDKLANTLKRICTGSRIPFSFATGPCKI